MRIRLVTVKHIIFWKIFLVFISIYILESVIFEHFLYIIRKYFSEHIVSKCIRYLFSLAPINQLLIYIYIYRGCEEGYI